MSYYRRPRVSLRTTPRRHGAAARARRLPLGPCADASLSETVPHRGSVRGPRGDRDGEPGRARGGARRSALPGGLPHAPGRGGRGVGHARPPAAPHDEDGEPPSPRVRRRVGRDAEGGPRAVGGHQAARSRADGPPTLRDRRRPALAALAAARSARPDQGGARALRLARRQVGVGQGGGGGPRSRRGARDGRGRARAGGARRRAVLPRERGAALLDRRRGGPAGRDREVPPTLRRDGGGPQRAGQVGRRGPARRDGAVVGEHQGPRAPPGQAMKLRIGDSSVSIERGDITDWEVDAIVNAANSTLAMGAGVAGAIKRKGGVIIEEEAMRQGPVEVGEAVLTTGGNLAATHVIHAAVMGPDLKTDAEKIAATTRAVLALAAKRRITSLALPALGTGVGHVPPAVSGEAMLNAVIGHLKAGGTSLKRVTFVLYQDDAYKAFTDTLKRLGGVQ